MKNGHKGFTLIEVSLFLAITGVLLIGIFAGTGNSINQQHYMDSVQGFTDFIKGIYSDVSNPQSDGSGRSEKAIYGRLMTFGEEIDRDGNKNENNTIYVYDIVGNVGNGIGGGDISSSLIGLNAGPTIIEKDDDGNEKLARAGAVKSYNLTWSAKVETTSSKRTAFKGAMLIVRSPSSGTIYTYIMYDEAKNDTVEVNKTIKNYNEGLSTVKNPLESHLKNGDFKIKEVNFCINDDSDSAYIMRRRNVQIVSNARNSSGINIRNQDTEDNKCEILSK